MIRTIAVPAQVMIVTTEVVAADIDRPNSDGSQAVYSTSLQHFVLGIGTDTLTVLLLHRVFSSMHFFTPGGTEELP